MSVLLNIKCLFICKLKEKIRQLSKYPLKKKEITNMVKTSVSHIRIVTTLFVYTWLLVTHKIYEPQENKNKRKITEII